VPDGQARGVAGIERPRLAKLSGELAEQQVELRSQGESAAHFVVLHLGRTAWEPGVAADKMRQSSTGSLAAQ